MKLEKGLKHQVEAVNSITRVFENINVEKANNACQNPIIDLTSLDIVNNIKKIQENNSVPLEMRKNIGITDQYLNIDVKMETGTGKTFTQIKTIYELNSRYGFNKFIIVVPTLPIKAGTKQFISSSDTKQFFKDEYNNIEIELRLVESMPNKKGRDYFPSVIREFVTASNLSHNRIQVMLINSQLITNGKMLTKVYDTSILDEYTKPCEAIKSTKPILIMDEPHKFSKENTTFNKIINMLYPQCIIRFGATFPDKKIGKNSVKDYQNLVYNLSSIDAFNNNLVKGVIAEYVPTINGKDLRIKVLNIIDKEKCIIQKIESSSKKSYELEKGESLSIVHEDFDGVEITAITKNSIVLSNGLEVSKGMELSPESYSFIYQDMMIETALERHFEIEKANFDKGIKTLALFFIDDISAYRKRKQDESKPTYILDSFEQILKTKLEKNINMYKDGEYREYLKETLKDIRESHAGYFSEDNSSKDEDIIKDVNDILNDKEKLLSIKDNKGQFSIRRFIFSKWTLKEGWDNPNIFTIAKLRSSGSENSKLQEVGRGLRLPVDNNKNRISNQQFYLNYIVDFTEKDFVNQLRNEITNELKLINKVSIEKIQEIAKERNENYSELFTQLLIEKCIEADGSVIPENREKLYSICPELREGLNQGKVIERKDKSASTTTIRKKQYEQISKLWELLNQKYIIKYDKFTNQELEYAILVILQEGLESDDEIVTKRNILSLSDDGAKTEELAGLSLATNKKLKYNDFLIKLSENTNIPIINIHNSLVKYSKIKYIDSKFFNETVLTNFIIKIEEWKENELFSRFTYKKTDLPIHPTALTDENGNLRETIGIGNIGTSKLDVKPQERYLYDTVAFDSPIEKDNIFEQISEVTVFGKIPKSSVKIPVANGGTYSPDFMYLVDKKDGSSELNLVIESKDVKMQKSLRGEEIYKIKCAEKLFGELKNSGINVVYKRQLKSNKMATIIRNIVK